MDSRVRAQRQRERAHRRRKERKARAAGFRSPEAYEEARKQRDEALRETIEREKRLREEAEAVAGPDETSR